MSGGHLFTQGPQGSGLLAGVCDLKGGAGDHGALEEGGVHVALREVGGLVGGHKGDAHPGVPAKQVQLAALQGAVEKQVVPHPHQREGDAVGALSAGGEGGDAVPAAVDHVKGKAPVPGSV